jgi:hypothetical protein
MSRGRKVIPLRPKLDSAAEFDRLTVRLILEQYRRGVLQEGVLVALLFGAGFGR